MPSVAVTPTPGTTPVPTPVPTGPPAATTSFAPTADASVRADSPTNNYGGDTTLMSDGQPVMAAYMKFDLTPLAGRAISKAALRMKVTNGSSGTQSLKLASDTSWAETGITYGGRPMLGAAFKTFAGGNAGSWVEVDVTSGIANRAGQVITLGIDSAGSDGYAFYSRESSVDKVTLVIESPGCRLIDADACPNTNSVSVRRPDTCALRRCCANSDAVTIGDARVRCLSLREGREWPCGRSRSIGVATQAGMNSDFADMKSGGITWARLDLYKTASPDPNLDYAVQAAKDHGISLVITVRKPSPDKDLGTEADRAVLSLVAGGDGEPIQVPRTALDDSQRAESPLRMEH